jgi:hypothetical protein
VIYSIPPYKRSPYKGRILLSDILGRRRPVDFVRESHPIRGRTPAVTCQLRDRPPPLTGGYTVHQILRACLIVRTALVDFRTIRECCLVHSKLLCGPRENTMLCVLSNESSLAPRGTAGHSFIAWKVGSGGKTCTVLCVCADSGRRLTVDPT